MKHNLQMYLEISFRLPMSGAVILSRTIANSCCIDTEGRLNREQNARIPKSLRLLPNLLADGGSACLATEKHLTACRRFHVRYILFVSHYCAARSRVLSVPPCHGSSGFFRLLPLSTCPPRQVIWRMMSHTLRFSAFIAMVMLSFALAFHAVFHTCSTPVNLKCETEDFEDFPLGKAFGTFGHSFVTVLSSALGGPDFDLFEEAGRDCRCNLPEGARNAGIFLMVVNIVCCWCFLSTRFRTVGCHPVDSNLESSLINFIEVETIAWLDEVCTA